MTSENEKQEIESVIIPHTPINAEGIAPYMAAAHHFATGPYMLRRQKAEAAVAKAKK